MQVRSRGSAGATDFTHDVALFHAIAGFDIWYCTIGAGSVWGASGISAIPPGTGSARGKAKVVVA